MKFKNAIQKGDFVMLRTFDQIMDKFNGVELDNCPIIGGRAIKFPDSDVLILDPNLILELGNAVRIKSVSDNRQRKRIYFHAENNGIKYPSDCVDDLLFDDRSVKSVMINGQWYDADKEICF